MAITTDPQTSVAPFVNTPLLDFSQPENIQAQAEALRQLAAEFGKTYPLIIGGERRYTEATFTTINPAHPEQALASFARAGVHEARQAVEAAHQRFQTWQYTPASERAGYLFAAAQLMRERRFLFNALMVYELSLIHI